MRFTIKILFVFLCLFVLAPTAIAQIRVIDNKGNVNEVDSSKWWLNGDNIYNKNSQNVIIGEPRTYVPSSRFTVNGTSTLPAFKLKYPFSGALTDSILTWNSTDSIVRKIPITKLNGNDWHTSGNAGTDSTNFLGTIDNVPLHFKINNENSGMISPTNTYFGYLAGDKVSTANGHNNTFIGTNSGKETTSGQHNAFIGDSAGITNTVGIYNTLIGSGADVTASNLINANAIGFNAKVSAGYSLILGGTGAYALNVGIGNTAPTNTLHVSPIVGVDPVRIEGLQAGTATNSIVVTDATGVLKSIPNTISNNWSINGNANTSFGTNFIGTTNSQPIQFKVNNNNAGRIGHNGNTSIGLYSFNVSATGKFNTVFGESALKVNTTGQNNAALGNDALNTNDVGSNNVAFGRGSGSTNVSGSDNVFIGFNADATAINFTNAIAIGSNAKVGASNSLVLGGTGSYAVNVGIGNKVPNNKLEITQGTTGNSGLRFTNLTASTTATLGADKFLSVDTNGDVVLRNVASKADQSALDATNTNLATLSATVSGRIEVAQETVATAAQTSFTLVSTPVSGTAVNLYINGVRIKGNALSVAGTVATYIPVNNGAYALSAGDLVTIVYIK